MEKSSLYVLSLSSYLLFISSASASRSRPIIDEQSSLSITMTRRSSLGSRCWASSAPPSLPLYTLAAQLCLPPFLPLSPPPRSKQNAPFNTRHGLEIMDIYIDYMRFSLDFFSSLSFCPRHASLGRGLMVMRSFGSVVRRSYGYSPCCTFHSFVTFLFFSLLISLSTTRIVNRSGPRIDFFPFSCLSAVLSFRFWFFFLLGVIRILR